MTNERREYIPTTGILDEVRRALKMHAPGKIDWVTIVGSGEPTLHSGLGKMIREIKEMTNLPIGVITNGSLCYLPEVRADLRNADAVMPTLDAGSENLYKKINRPWPKLTFSRLVEGLIAFRAEYRGNLWVEVMLIRGLNDEEKALNDLAIVLKRIAPDQVYLNLPIRPPAERWVQPTDEEGLLRAQAILGDVVGVLAPAQGEFDLSGYESIEEAILSLVTRHPMREDDLLKSMQNLPSKKAKDILMNLVNSGRAQIITRYGTRFWTTSGTKYAN